MTKQELIREAFSALNNFKRHRALAEIKPLSERQHHELQMYKMIDQLELALRAINKEIREEIYKDVLQNKEAAVTVEEEE